MPAIAGSNYSQCVEAANPAQCIARRAVDSSRLDPEEQLEMVLRHARRQAGRVALSQQRSRKRRSHVV